MSSSLCFSTMERVKTFKRYKLIAPYQGSWQRNTGIIPKKETIFCNKMSNGTCKMRKSLV